MLIALFTLYSVKLTFLDGGIIGEHPRAPENRSPRYTSQALGPVS